MRVKPVYFIVVMIMLTVLSCEKYEDGGRLGKADENIAATLWKIESAIDLSDNNADITTDFTGELWEFTVNGIFKINAEIKGTYSFSADMMTLFISNKSGTEADIYTVDRLDDEAMWLIMPGELELHFVPN